MNLLFCIDHKNLGAFLCSLKSICLHGGYPHYEVYLLHAGLNDSHAAALYKDFGEHMTFHMIESPSTRNAPRNIHERFAAALLLPDQLERVLYLDADTIVINPLNELYEMDLGDSCFAYCPHTKADRDAADPNSGVLLFDLQELRKAICGSNHGDMSAHFENKAKDLDPLRFDLSDRMMNRYNKGHWLHRIDVEWVRESTSIIHYCGSIKPWEQDYMQESWAYSMTNCSNASPSPAASICEGPYPIPEQARKSHSRPRFLEGCANQEKRQRSSESGCPILSFNYSSI